MSLQTPTPSPKPAALLAGWEAASVVPSVARSAALLHHLGQTDGWEAALDLPVGACAALAAEVYVEAFGPQVEVLLSCSECGELLESMLDLGGLAGSMPLDADGRAAPVSVVLGPVTVRTPTTRDLLAVRGEPDGVIALLSRCLRHADGRWLENAELARLSDPELAAIDAAAEALAGPASTAVHARCPRCRTDFDTPIDIGALLWEQVSTTARHLLTEVVALSRALGWSEQAVIALSPTRRAAYLELVAQHTGHGLTASVPG